MELVTEAILVHIEALTTRMFKTSTASVQNFIERNGPAGTNLRLKPSIRRKLFSLA